MNVGLIDTGDKTFSRMPHAGLVALTAYLAENGHQVEVLDLFFADQAAQSAFFQRPFDLVGISATSYSCVTAAETARAIKRVNPGQAIVLGGPHVSIAREEVLAEQAFDFAIYGEGERPLLSLLSALEAPAADRGQAFARVPGLIFRQNGRIVLNPPQGRIRDLDALPFPRYDLFDMQAFGAYPLVTSRGCPYGCIYCASAAVIGRKWTARSPESLLAEIDHVIAACGKRPFYIIDDCFNLDIDRVKRFCRLLLERDDPVEWGACGIRADRCDPEMASLMKASGCSGVCVGVESADPAVLEHIGKEETIEAIETGIALLHAAGLSLCGMFMIGNPGDTLETVRRSIAFAKEQPFDLIRFYLALPYPRTGLWEYVKRHGRFLRTDYENFHDFSDQPLFETDDFTRAERIQAYEEAKAVMFPGGVPQTLCFDPQNGFTGKPETEAGSHIRTRFAPQ